MARNPLSPFRSGGLAERGGYGGDPFLSLHREMNRLFDDVLRGSFGVPVQSGEQGGGMMMPHMDVSETENEVRICAELPGVSEKDVDVSLSGDVLTIRGEKKLERKDDTENYHFVERSYGTFQRSLRLPYAVDPDQVQASFENGVLAVTLPKGKEQERSRRIQVIGSSGQASQGEQNQKARKGSSSSRGGPTS
jgi:HSP20 family protein